MNNTIQQTEENQLTIKQAEHTRFMKLFEAGQFNGQRLGQAFYNHFNLHRLTDQQRLRNLYECDGQRATALIREVFVMT